MRNTSKIKRVLALCLIFLLSINSFAATTGDNDGSAFITKAEFDSLKNNFQSQIDMYNSSIDSKIDAAIAGYLSGINLEKERILTVCHSFLEYPLTLRHLGPYAGDDVKHIAKLDNGEKLWTDELDCEFNGQRHGNSWFQTNPFQKRVNNRIKNFYNGNVKPGVFERFKISSVWTNYNVLGSLTSCVHQFSTKATAHETWGWCILMDTAQDQTKGGQLRKDTWDRTTTDADKVIDATNNNRRTFPSNTRPFYLGLWGQYNPDGTQAASTITKITSTKVDGVLKFDRLIATFNSGWIEYSIAWANWLQSATHNTSQLNDILVSVAREAEETETYLPVLYDGTIKVTNVNNSKKDLCGVVSYVNEQEDKTRLTPTNIVAIHHVIEPGFVIDSENNKVAGSAWSTTSLVKGTRLLYDEVLPYTKGTVECAMGDGVLLTEIPDNLSQLKVSIKPTWPITYQTVASEKKYIMFSKLPIGEDITDISQSLDQSKYIDIATSDSETAPKSKLVELTNNTSQDFYLGKFSKNDRIYYKITWGYDDANVNRWQETVSVELPQIKGTVEE